MANFYSLLQGFANSAKANPNLQKAQEDSLLNTFCSDLNLVVPRQQFFALRPRRASTPHAQISVDCDLRIYLQMAAGKLFVRFFSYFAFCQDVPVYITTLEL